MAKLIEKPSIIEAAGNKPKIIREFIGQVNSNTSKVSIAKMTSPGGWIEPGQKPEFDEYTVVLKGIVNVKVDDKLYEVKEGQAIVTYYGEHVQYSTPNPEGAEYIAVCLPAFSPDIVHREDV
jgi:mannose-6-phosphate isomerase-like protein (cupin superfamily)